MNQYIIPILIIVALAKFNEYILKRVLRSNGFDVKNFFSQFKNIANTFSLVNNIDNKGKRKKYFTIGVLAVLLDIAFIVCAILLFSSMPSVNDAYCNALKRFESQEYKVVVVDKYTDLKQHLYPTLILQDNKGNKIVNQEFTIDKSGFYEYVKIGDTLTKLKDDRNIQIKNTRVDTLITIDLGCIEK